MLKQMYLKAKSDKKLQMLISLGLTENLALDNYLDFATLRLLDLMSEEEKTKPCKTISIKRSRPQYPENSIGIRRRHKCQ